LVFAVLLAVAGIAGIGVGLYFLLLAPGDVQGGTIVRLHRLTLGQTFTISGSVLFGASFVGAAAAGV